MLVTEAAVEGTEGSHGAREISAVILRAVDLKCPEADGGRPIVRACCARIVRRECETVERAGVASRP